MLRLVLSVIFITALASGTAVKSLSGSSTIDGSCATPNTKYLRDLKYCTKFYYCDNGKTIEKNCESRTSLNVETGKCEKSEFQKCLQAKRMAFGNLECPEHESTPTFHPHPTDCSKFYECSNGEPVLHECSPGLHWNTEKKTCDYPENAHCTEGSESDLKNRARRWISRIFKVFK